MAVMDRSGAVSAGTGQRHISAMDRIGALSGVAYVVFANLGGALVGEGSADAESPGQRILDEQQRLADSPLTNVAFAVILLAQLALIVFVGYVCSRVRDAGWFANTALVGGAAALFANLLSLSTVSAIFILRDDMSPELARALTAVDGAGHLMQLLPLGVFVLFASAAALVTATLGRVLSWAGIVVGATCIVGLAATGIPRDENLFIWPFLLFLVWTLVISLRLGFARSHTSEPAPVAVTES
ncbi:MAG: hypothetical protein JWM51_1020 [Microbacteriaceae bacterium]|jgi:hypothetical protein|nr:hypothetical protein [Microbacteriaceae bacterium]